MTFYQVVEEINKLSKDEKEEIKDLLESYLIEDARKEFKKNYEESIRLKKEGKLRKLSNLDEFDKELNRED
jgi:hypothetical protein